MKYLYLLFGILILVESRRFKNRHDRNKNRHMGRNRNTQDDDYVSLDEVFAEATTPAELPNDMVVEVTEVTEDTELETEEATTTITTTTTTTTTTLEPVTLRPLSTYDYSVWCKLQPIQFDCDGRGITRVGFQFEATLKNCIPTTYSTCASNFNRFKDARTCNKVCRTFGSSDLFSENAEVLCRLQPQFGDCQNYYPMYYYDVNERLCKGFSFSGCGGNTNRFHTAIECLQTCGQIIQYVPE